MPINQRRPDTPLANSPEPRFVQDSIKTKTWNQMSSTERKDAQTKVRAKGGREGFSTFMDSITKSQFAEGAARKNMTVAEYSKYLEKNKNAKPAGLDGLEIGKACKRGSTKGSCSTGTSNKGESLRDTK